MGDTIRDGRTHNARWMGSSSSAAAAARATREEHVGQGSVVEGDRLSGTVTDRDIAVGMVAEGKSPERINVGEIASRELVTIDAAQELDEALRLMAKHRVRRLPVVEKDGKLIGIVAQADVAKHATSTQTGEVVEKISN